MIIFSDKELARRLETIEAMNQVDFAIAHKRRRQDSAAGYKKIGSGYAVFAGVDSPLTQAFALGFDGAVGDGEIAELETFFAEHDSATNIEVSHHADMSLTMTLMDRGFRISEYSNVLLRRLGPGDDFPIASGNEIHQVGGDEITTLAQTVARGFAESEDPAPALVDVMETFFQQANSLCFAATRGGRLAGGGAIFVRDGVAALAGASTLPEFRKLGIQSDLLKTRLKIAAEKGCELAMVTTLPGSLSQRNMEKLGFQVVYARTKFTKAGGQRVKK